MLMIPALVLMLGVPDLLPRTGLRTPPGKPVLFGAELGGAMRVLTLVQNGPAQKAGLQVGDKVLKVNGRPVEDSCGFAQALRSATGEMTLVVERSGKSLDLRIVFSEGQSPENLETGPDTSMQPVSGSPWHDELGYRPGMGSEHRKRRGRPRWGLRIYRRGMSTGENTP